MQVSVVSLPVPGVEGKRRLVQQYLPASVKHECDGNVLLFFGVAFVLLLALFIAYT